MTTEEQGKSWNNSTFIFKYWESKALSVLNRPKDASAWEEVTVAKFLGVAMNFFVIYEE